MFNAPCFAQKALFGQMSTVVFQLRGEGVWLHTQRQAAGLKDPNPHGAGGEFGGPRSHPAIRSSSSVVRGPSAVSSGDGRNEHQNPDGEHILPPEKFPVSFVIPSSHPPVSA